MAPLRAALSFLRSKMGDIATRWRTTATATKFQEIRTGTRETWGALETREKVAVVKDLAKAGFFISSGGSGLYFYCKHGMERLDKYEEELAETAASLEEIKKGLADIRECFKQNNEVNEKRNNKLCEDIEKLAADLKGLEYLKELWIVSLFKEHAQGSAPAPDN